MSLIIRLSKVGRRGEKKYRVVVKEKRSKRDGKAIDIIGFYEKRRSGSASKIDKNKFEHWTSRGAHVTAAVQELLDKQVKEII